ncbi:hypothetical protein H6P81_001249 [Aristolochia fimbriata]|uniref:Hexosyltransferase n=1 Tax=Aristolochia fimbriata TaxID=158543 RepID=A0AAV7F7L4_ARIFI|nr:hypothetical protein H6P81_001249 [Aristolochia fimbriata]
MWVLRVLAFFLVASFLPSDAIRSFPEPTVLLLPRFAEAPAYRNGPHCPVSQGKSAILACDPAAVHISMTLDVAYLRGSVAAVHSILKHASCPENIFFHFLTTNPKPDDSPLAPLLRSTFPSLSFNLYHFDPTLVLSLISSSVRDALQNPLNYARTYLADILPSCVSRVIYLDSDLIVVDDILRLWTANVPTPRVIAAPQYCNANFTKYFNDVFWSDPSMSRVFHNRNPCYFNTGVMVMDLGRWRQSNYGKVIEDWMRVQKEKRIYELGSLPPFLLVFAGEIEPIEHRWNQHGLGGDNVVGSCRNLHPGPVSLLHWSGKGKPWARLDAKTPCPLDSLWAPYDLYTHLGSSSSS